MPAENENEIENTEVIENDDEPTLEDVISQAIDEVTPDDVLEANKDTSETDTGAEQTPEEIAAAEAAAAAEAEQTPEEIAAAAEAAEQTPEEIAAAEAAAEAEQTPEQKAAAEAVEAAKTPEEKAAAEAAVTAATAEAAKEVDPVNDPIPESTNAKTATRIKSLIDIAKDTTHRAEQADEIVQRIADTGADPKQYANTLGFLALYNSADPAQRKQALADRKSVV